MKKIFECEFPDDLGPEWLNINNLELLLYTTEFTNHHLLKVREITDPSVKVAIKLLEEK